MELFIWLKKNKISSRQFAKTLGISPASVSNILNKNWCASLIVALKIQKETKGEVQPVHLLSEVALEEWKNYLMEKELKTKKVREGS